MPRSIVLGATAAVFAVALAATSSPAAAHRIGYPVTIGFGAPYYPYWASYYGYAPYYGTYAPARVYGYAYAPAYRYAYAPAYRYAYRPAYRTYAYRPFLGWHW
jgi:hypothetical protein